MNSRGRIREDGLETMDSRRMESMIDIHCRKINGLKRRIAYREIWQNYTKYCQSYFQTGGRLSFWCRGRSFYLIHA
jgi:hypothetical protein